MARLYHLGLDWGTSATKLVLRDYEQQKAFVLFPEEGSDYRYPSTVLQNGARLYFGFKAEEFRHGAKAFDALKADICTGADTFKEDLATLYLAHVINIGFNFAEEHARRTNDQARLGLTLGIPAEELEQSTFRRVYLRMIRTAYEIAVSFKCDVQGEDRDDCLTMLKLARQKIRERDERTPPQEDLYAQWLRPELAAAMYWGTKSPTLQDGLFSCVDIGAWTTNASYFRIKTRRLEINGVVVREKQINFYGGACQPPGMLKLIKALSRARRRAYSSFLGREERLFLTTKNGDDQQIESCGSEYFSTWKLGFQRSYQMDRRTGAWQGKLNVMIVGGGSKVDKVRKFFHEFPNKSNWPAPIQVPDFGSPTDLYGFPETGIIPTRRYENDSSFLLVAYGLSVNSGDFPQTRLAPQVAPFVAQQRQVRFGQNQCRDCGRPPVMGSDRCYACGG